MKRFLCMGVLVLITASAYAQEPGWIGVSIADAKDQGVEIRSLDSDGPAAKAGLREGDVITEYNKVAVIGVLQLTRLVRETPVARTVEVKVRRGTADQTFKLTTAERPSLMGRNIITFKTPDADLLRDRIERAIPKLQMRPSVSQSGIRVDEMTSQLREFFGVKTADGVLVTSVDPGSAAATAGVNAGDIIVAVDGDRVGSTSEFSRHFRNAGDTITLKIVRDKQERDFTVQRRSTTGVNRV